MAIIDKIKIFQHKKLSHSDSLYQKLTSILEQARAYYGVSLQKKQMPLEGNFFEVAKDQSASYGLHALKAEKFTNGKAPPILSIIDDKTAVIALKKPNTFRKQGLANTLVFLFPFKKSISELLPKFSPFIAAFYQSAVLFFLIWLSVRSLTNNPNSFFNAWPYLLSITLIPLIIVAIIARIGRAERIIILDLTLLQGLFVNKSTYYGNNITDVINKSRMLLNYRECIIHSSVFIVTMIMLSLFVPRQNLLLLALFTLILGLLFFMFKQITTKFKKSYHDAHERLKDDYHFILSVFPDVSGLNLVGDANKNLQASSLNEYLSFTKKSFFNGIERGLGFFIPFILVLLVTVNAALFHRSLDLDHLFLVILIGFIFYTHLRVLIQSLPKKLPHQLIDFASVPKIVFSSPSGKIELEKIFFKYQTSNYILDNVTMVINPKSLVGIFGPSGSGKSTLIKLLMAHHAPTAGQLIFDGQGIGNLALESLKKHMGVITPDSRLMTGTIFENIILARKFSKKQVEALFEHRFLWPLLDLPMGLNTYVMWHGQNVSTKTASLILLARALIHQPTFLFLDEIHLGQTLQEEMEVVASLKNLNITTVISSHNNELSSLMDQSIFLTL